jgi:hypothetical protein
MKSDLISSTGVCSNRSDGFDQRFSYWGFPDMMMGACARCAKAHIDSLPNAV